MATAQSPMTETPEAWDQISRQIRANMGLGRDKFARLLQVSTRTVMRWENGQASERVVPQGIQRMKLLALMLDDAASEIRQQDILGSMMEEASGLRASYEQKATTIRRYEIELDAPPPAWFDDLLRLKQEQNWSALLLMGPHFLPADPVKTTGFGGAVPAGVEALVCLWIGIAAFMQGLPRLAAEWSDRALALAGLPLIVRCVLLSNKALAFIRIRRFEEAEAALAECLALDPAHRGALRNKLVLYSQTDNEPAAYEAALDLLQHYPVAGDPAAELGRLIAEDPDLTNFRATAAFGLAFPGLGRVIGPVARTTDDAKTETQP